MVAALLPRALVALQVYVPMRLSLPLSTSSISLETTILVRSFVQRIVMGWVPSKIVQFSVSSFCWVVMHTLSPAVTTPLGIGVGTEIVGGLVPMIGEMPSVRK